MAEAVMEQTGVDTAEAGVSRIYEIGYLVVSTVAEDNIEQVVASIRTPITAAGGSFIAEGAPSMIRLAYDMTAREGDKNVDYDRAYFGWLKFEGTTDIAEAINEALRTNPQILRHIVFRTVREDTRAKMKAPQLREIKTPHVARTAPRREEETAAPVSEADLDKAIDVLTTD